MKKKPKSRDARADNARTHGAFASGTYILDESGAEFEEIYRGCITEYQPSGPTEEAVVKEIAEDLWRKRRALEFFSREDQVLRKLPWADDLIRIEKILITIKVVSPSEAWAMVKLLPESVREEVREELNGPDSDDDSSWTEQLTQSLEKKKQRMVHANTTKALEPDFHAEIAGKRFNLMNKYAELDERLDRSLERKFRRLATIRTHKEIQRTQNGRSVPLVVQN